MPEEIELQPEKKQDIPERAKETPPRWREKLKIRKWKILGGILGAFVFVGAVFGAYKLGQRPTQTTPQSTPTPEVVATPTPDPTVDWKTYKNSRFRYSIKYPNDWELSQELERVTMFANKDYKVENYEVKEGASLSVWVSDNPTIITEPEEWYAQGPTEYKILSKSKIYIDEHAAVKFRAYGGVGTEGEWDGVLVHRVGFMYEFHLLKAPGVDSKTLNLILSTFRFLPSTSSGQGEESCVKTETGEEMNLSEAKEIALKSECVKEGNFKEEHFCNQTTGTWWIDLDIQKEGCAPACVINVSTKKAKINWRCTGLITP